MGPFIYMLSMVSRANGWIWISKSTFVNRLLHKREYKIKTFTIYSMINHIERMKITYYPTHLRMGAWIVGILTGYILHKIKDRRIILTRVNLTFELN